MRNGKFAKRGVASKTLVLILALVLVIGVSVGGTLAWLTATSDEVKNTFTTSDIKITLDETTGADYKMVPGYTIKKDPKVTVNSGSEYCWLFVEIKESSTLDTHISYSVDNGWTAGTGNEADGNGVPVGVWFREIDTADEINKAFSVLTGDQVTVKDTVTKTDMEALKAGDAVQPTLTFKAYASQLMKNNTEEFSAADAWANVPQGLTP